MRAPPATKPRARFRDLLVSEWIKLRSLRSFIWGLALITLFVIASSADAAYADYSNWSRFPAEDQAHFYALRDAFVNNAYLGLMLATGALGAVALVSEYSSGLIRTTFAAVPARRSVLAAKMAVVAATMLAAGSVIALASFGISQAILSGRHAGLSIGHAGVPRAIVASALLPPVCALVGMGIGALIRHTASTVVATVVALLVLPQFFDEGRRFKADLLHAMPVSAWHTLTNIDPSGYVHGPYPPTMSGAGAALAAWPLAAALLAVIVVHRRDV